MPFANGTLVRCKTLEELMASDGAYGTVDHLYHREGHSFNALGGMRHYCGLPARIENCRSGLKGRIKVTWLAPLGSRHARSGGGDWYWSSWMFTANTNVLADEERR